MRTPDHVRLTKARTTERAYRNKRPAEDATERRRRQLMDIASGRIAWLCAQKNEKGEGNAWRGLTHRELLESLKADVAAYRMAEAEHKEASRIWAANKYKPVKKPRRRLFGLFGPKQHATRALPDDAVSYSTAPFRDVPMIVDTVKQLERGLELLVERGFIKKEGDGDDAVYTVLPRFLDGLALHPLREIINEP